MAQKPSRRDLFQGRGPDRRRRFHRPPGPARAGLLLAALAATFALHGTARAQVDDPASGAAAINTQALACNADAGGEARALKTAPRGARRVSDHVLVVNLASGPRRLADRRPYRDGLDGFHWRYCGYIPALHAHLIGSQENDLFTGKLLFDRGGPLMAAGVVVYPSPSGKLFLASSQKNGEVLSRWVISDLSGRRLWSGPSGLPRATGAPVIFEEVHWMGNDALRVRAWCNDGTATRGEGTLTRQGATWIWHSALKCSD